MSSSRIWSGTTHIADFVAGELTDDKIDVSAFFSNFEELQAASSVNEDGDVVIVLDHNDTLILVGVTLDGLTNGDFVGFV